MAACGYSSLVNDISCGPSICNPAVAECLILGDCKKDIKGHLRSYSVNDSYLKTESWLLLARAGKYCYVV